MTTDRLRIAAERRATVRAMRAAGHSWRECGEAIGVSYQRASQLGKSVRTVRAKPRPSWRGTIGEYLAHVASGGER